jgi:hypothetical protein
MAVEIPLGQLLKPKSWLLKENRGFTLEAASDVLYNSKLYGALENEGTKAWHLSYPVIYDMLEEELTTLKSLKTWRSVFL